MKIYKEIVKKLEGKLDILEIEIEDVLVKAEKGIKFTKQALKDVRDLVTDCEFETVQSEISFFKKTKPRLLSKLIYYVKLFNIESKRPRSSSKSQIKYLNKHIDRLQNYFNDNLEFYQYYRRNATSLDEQYFLRGKADIRLYSDTFHFFTDEQFSTSHDSTVATILAYDMLIVHLKTEIDTLEKYNGAETINLPFIKKTKLFWTGHKTDLIELIYALHSCGIINSGTAGIKELAIAAECLFNVNLGNYYHTFVDIRSRKVNNTKFIDMLKEALLKRYQESDA
jgi:hypothetical protein